MANLRDIRNRIDSVENTKQITRAMKMVAAAKLRRAQERIFETRPYAYKLHQIIQHLREHLEPAKHPWFAEPEDVGRVLLVVISSDRGLCGAFNSNVFELTEETIEGGYPHIFDRGDGAVLPIGSKGYDHYRRQEEVRSIGDFRQFFDPLTFEQTVEVVDEIVAGYEAGRWDEVKIVYNEFRNTISQDQIVEPFLPISEEQFTTPAMEELLESRPAAATHAVDYLSEPDVDTLLEEIVPRYVRFQLWRIVLESNASEQGARMAAMDNATTNAEELLEELELTYNRARQEAITTEILEIASGAEALSEEQ